MTAALVWDSSLGAYSFGPDHPFSPLRQKLAIGLIRALALAGDGFPVVPPRMATDAELLRVHDPAFLQAIQRLGEPGADPRSAARWGLGTDDTPVFPGMYEASARVAGGTLRAAELVLGGDATRAFHLSGGLHHAHAARASGFCIVNDLAAAIASIRADHGARVLCIDFDAHHGDGTQSIFYRDPEVLTLSFHESGRFLFPGTGFPDELGEGDGYGRSWNVPLDAFTEDGSWTELYAALVPAVAEAFRPDVIVLQTGCDGHVLDPLTHLRATTGFYEAAMRVTCEVADRVCGGRIVATAGGGYSIWNAAPRVWTLVWAALSGQRAPDPIPLEWREEWQGASPELLPERLRDAPDDFPGVPCRAEIEAVNRGTLATLRREALPTLRGWGMGF